LSQAPEAEQEGPVIQLLQSISSDTPVHPETPNSEAWRPPAALSVGSDVVPITYNPPTVIALELPSRLIPGFPVLANVQLMYADEKACEWEWLRLLPGQGMHQSALHDVCMLVESVHPSELRCAQRVSLQLM
jgi:hypothetical protein